MGMLAHRQHMQQSSDLPEVALLRVWLHACSHFVWNTLDAVRELFIRRTCQLPVDEQPLALIPDYVVPSDITVAEAQSMQCRQCL